MEVEKTIYNWKKSGLEENFGLDTISDYTGFGLTSFYCIQKTLYTAFPILFVKKLQKEFCKNLQNSKSYREFSV